MNRKLTLSVDEKAIERGKEFAAQNQTSISSLVESFFLILGSKPTDDEVIEISPKLMSLVGIGKGNTTEEDYKKHLAAKHV